MPHRSGRPAPTEYAAYYADYVAEVAGEDALPCLEEEGRVTAALLATIPEARAGHRYAPDKWSVRQLVLHLADTERVFAHRALVFARGDGTPQPGFDENAYAVASAADSRTLAEVAHELAAVRRATLALLGGLAPEAWGRRGSANGAEFTVRAVAFIIAGHERHHREVLRQRYLAGGVA